MASPKSPHQNHVNIHNFFPPHPPPPAAASASPSPSSSAAAASFFPYQHANVHPQTLVPYHASPPLHANAGNQILALINSSNNNVKRQASAAFCLKVAKGRTLSGDYVSYDVDERIEGDREPQQLEVTPITKYGSDPDLVIGRQIAVNKHYICYGLKAGNIRVLNLNTASRSLFRGHTKRVTDMAFFSDDVHVLASVSVDRRVYVWKICEGPDEEDKPQITGNLVTAIQFFEEGKTEYVHPRICWHCSNQDVLVAGIGNSVLRIDTTKVGECEAYSAEAPLPCSTDGITKGVYLFGKHDGQVTDLSMCHWKTTTRLVSASSDGTIHWMWISKEHNTGRGFGLKPNESDNSIFFRIKIWEDRQAVPLAVLIPYSGQPVNSATLFTSPHHAEHVILITAGPLNREVKIWAPVSKEGLPQPDHAELWKCTQTLELKSSAEPRVEEAFFNQVVALSQAGILLIANAKKNAIYALHIEYGATPNTSRMDYIAEFTVTMPILSFTGTFNPREDHTIKVYCVQTLAIQQYALDLCQCLPPAIDNLGLENTGSTVSCGPDNAERFPALDLNGAKYSGFTFPGSASKPTTSVGSSETSASMRYPVRSTSLDVAASREVMTSNMETGPVSLACATDAGFLSVASPPPLSPRLLRKLSGTRDATPSSELLSNLSDVHTFDNAAKNDEKEVASNDVSRVISSPVMFKHLTHLVTPSEILMAVSPSETTNFAESKNDKEVSIQDVVVNKEVGNAEVEVKVVGETQGVTDELGFHGEPQDNILGNREKFFCSQASDLGIQTTREYHRISAENNVVEEAQAISGNGVSHRLTQLRLTSEAEVQGMDESVGPSAMRQKQKEGTSRASGQFSPSPNVLHIDSSSSVSEAVLSQVQTMQETLNQLLAMQKDWQNLVSSIVTFAVTREGRRQEAALSCDFEKLLKANNDALWARFQEENAKNDKLLRGRLQQITSSVSNLINKDLTTLLEKTVKKEMAAILPAAVRTITPTIEKAASSAILESFQRYVGDKAVNQLERSVNSRLEATVGRQIQTQFQTSGKQALQDALKSSFEASMIPAFEKSCKVMFDQVDATFQRGMIEHRTAAQQHIDSIHSQLALALRDSINSVSSMAQTLSGQLADSQRNLLNLAATGANPSTVNPLLSQLSGTPLHLLREKVEAPMDPAKELSKLISELKYEEAFTTALQRSDVSIVSWLCSQVDLHGILSMVPIPLTQGVLLSLLQQLACDIHNDTPRKLAWLTDVAAAINPADQMIAVHVRPIFEQVFQRLNHHRTSPSITGSELSSIRLLIHVINSMLMTCK